MKKLTPASLILLFTLNSCGQSQVKKNTMNQNEHKFTNHLIHESSPYLLQHAHNPVNWYPWGTEALDKARAENKPILVSIGYAACHWCHVMEHESFENEEVANFMNEHFICIKVDREERPDIDQIYECYSADYRQWRLAFELYCIAGWKTYLRRNVFPKGPMAGYAFESC